MDEEKKTLTRREMLKYMGVAGAAISASSPVPIILKYISPKSDWPAEKGEIPVGPVNPCPGGDKAPSHQKIGSTEASGPTTPQSCPGPMGCPLSKIFARIAIACRCITGTEF